MDPTDLTSSRITDLYEARYCEPIVVENKSRSEVCTVPRIGLSRPQLTMTTSQLEEHKGSTILRPFLSLLAISIACSITDSEPSE